MKILEDIMFVRGDCYYQHAITTPLESCITNAGRIISL